MFNNLNTTFNKMSYRSGPFVGRCSESTATPATWTWITAGGWVGLASQGALAAG